MNKEDAKVGMTIQRPGLEKIGDTIAPYSVVTITRIPLNPDGTRRKMIECRLPEGRLFYVTDDQFSDYEIVSPRG